MNFFPVSKSFLRRDAIAHYIAKEYGVGNVRCQLITTTLRDVYLISSSQNRYILYIYRHGQRSVDEISAEWQFVNYLHASGLPVMPPVPNKSGEYLLEFSAPEGIRLGVLTQFAQGVILRRRSSLTAVRAYGRIAARIHELADAMPFALKRPEIDFAKLIPESVRAFEKEADERSDALAYLRQTAEILSIRQSKLSKEKPFYGMVHGDVIRANALVANDDRVTILDFDLCGLGWRAYDVASFLLTIRDTPQEQDFEKAFLEGYAEIRPLASHEIDTLPLFETIRAIISIGIPAMNIEHWGSQYFYSFVDHDLAALKRSMARIV